jgi:rubrerythrin
MSCCGRPFFDGEQMLLAPARARTDWLEECFGLTNMPDTATRAALARVWLRDAQLEHASIAAFSRFSLQLLALGAPAELVSAAQQAALDEVDHAQACFALASRYAGRAVGPGELPMPSSLTLASLADAAAASVREGCVAETIAARLAYEQLQHASDEQAQAALIRIATDETRHAALAYQFVRWAIAAGGSAVHAAVYAAFVASREQLLAAETERQDEVALEIWHAHGRLSVSEQRACVLACLRDVIEPCADALLAGLSRGGATASSHVV